MQARAANQVLRARARERHVTPPPNPLEDPLAHIKRPLKPLNFGRYGSRVVRRGHAVVEFDQFDVKLIRAKFLATQKQFARLIGVSYETLRNWERGRRRPHGPARALLRAIDADPFALARALNWRLRDFQEEPDEWLDT